MKNRKIKLISSVLTVLMLVAAILPLLPAKASAAYSKTVASASSYSTAQIKNIVAEALLYGSDTEVELEGGTKVSLKFETAEDCLNYELGRGYLDGVATSDGKYSVYVNRYTGMMYYRNNLTGQILTSNSFEPAYSGASTPLKTRQTLMSQIQVKFYSALRNYDYNSTEWAANYAQISTSAIENGIRVNYTLGDTTTRFFLPGRISVESFEGYFLKPMVEDFEALAVEHLGEKYTFFGNEKYTDYLYGCIYLSSSDLTVQYGDTREKIKGGLQKYLGEVFNSDEFFMLAWDKSKKQAYDEINALYVDINTMLSFYDQVNPAFYEKQTTPGAVKIYEDLIATYYSDSSLEIYETHEPFYRYKGHDNQILANVDRVNSKLMQKYANGFTFAMMYSEEKNLGYVDDSEAKPVIRCALEYTFNADGSLSVRLPANSISFDETLYTLTSITPLMYFGAGDTQKDGYIFFPDGSGTIIDFKDFGASMSIYGSGNVYGSDYCYSTITGAHRQPVSLPVYGVASTVATNPTVKANGLTTADWMRTGYFAVLEEGASLATLVYETGGTTHKYGTAYASFNPYPSDTIDLSETGGSGKYNIVSDSKYNGSYVTRYAMLSDPEVGAAAAAAGLGGWYDASYIGMATFYRNYLKETGVLTAIADVSADMPLYIETLGSMEITDKFLSFPVTKDIPLTTFDDIREMYTELSAAGVPNIHFRLTGFANDGMYYTYPTRLRWERVVGGKSGFRKLVADAKKTSAEEGKNFAVYPDFDFLYIHHTALFDGITLKGNVSRKVDNRYASKQTYNAISGEFESHFTLAISADVLDKLYSKFHKRYSKYDIQTLSISSAASDINSNFDPDQPVNRDEAKGYIESLLERIHQTEGYTLMSDVGNIYAVRYVQHLLNVSTDSSHFRYSSYPIPFIGMILHGYVSYAGSPINYAGTTDYELLRAIESGASLYYILCYRNTSYMKDDDELNRYYGVDYQTWKSEILETYEELNDALKNYQTWQIVGHEIILGERVIESAETAENYRILKEEYLQMVSDQIFAAINLKFKEMRDNGTSGKLGVTIDADALYDKFVAVLSLEDGEKAAILDEAFRAALQAVADEYTAEYPAEGAAETIAFTDTDLRYDSQYRYLTESDAKAADYHTTVYTSDLNNIVLVTYSDGTESASFILNYNIYDVVVRLNGEQYTVPMYGYAKVR